MAPKAQAVFLHTGYRTAGTWLWSCFRRLDEVAAWYEPLHEMLATIDHAKIATSTADSWRSGHPALDAPYFAEFSRFLRPGGVGIAGYEARFAIDRLDGEAEPEDAAAIKAYVRTLIAASEHDGRMPVFKFCRSLGRLPWFHRTFADAAHIVVLKNPVSQWQSCWQLLAKHRNAHFVAVPFAVLSFNRDDPVVRRTLDALRVTLPDVPAPSALEHRDIVVHTLTYFSQYVASLAPLDAYRGFLAHWLLSLRHVAMHADAIFDCDLASWSPHYLQSAQRWVQRLTGLAPTFPSSAQHGLANRSCGFDAMEGFALHLDAARLAAEWVQRGLMHADTLALIQSKLAQATQVQGFGLHAHGAGAPGALSHSTHLMQVNLIDGADLDATLFSELSTARAALADAQQRHSDTRRRFASRAFHALLHPLSGRRADSRLRDPGRVA
ncbi:hypothetical protein [Paraburkholderia phosphatilytica]|uniref:hypothetical protein n=1 Tax=Paraburkholderia phosphatilytica TaxID=2282883 RepID=UPI000E51D2F1|nr:hypothetical protein [Paraburkholderia phosphatilytica]